jgi:hypothetical protein
MAINAKYNQFIEIILWLFIIFFQVIAVLFLILAAWYAYDGFYNKRFIALHTSYTSQPDVTLLFNRGSPPFFVAAAVILIILTLCLKWLVSKITS